MVATFPGGLIPGETLEWRRHAELVTQTTLEDTQTVVIRVDGLETRPCVVYDIATKRGRQWRCIDSVLILIFTLVVFAMTLFRQRRRMSRSLLP